MALHDLLKEMRERRGASLQEVADAVGVSKTHLWHLEAGKSANPTIDLLSRLADYYDTTVSVLVGEDLGASAELVAIVRDLKELDERDLETVRSLVKTLKRQSRG